MTKFDFLDGNFLTGQTVGCKIHLPRHIFTYKSNKINMYIYLQYKIRKINQTYNNGVKSIVVDCDHENPIPDTYPDPTFRF